jgi:hypothetical protein
MILAVVAALLERAHTDAERHEPAEDPNATLVVEKLIDFADRQNCLFHGPEIPPVAAGPEEKL